MSGPRETPLLPPDDDRRRYVRFGRLTARGFVEFSFGVDSPDLMTDLVLPLEDYKAFCRSNRVVHLTCEQAEALDHEQAKWRYGAAGIHE